MINNKSKDIRADPKKTAREYQFEGEVRGDLCFKPWKIPVKFCNFKAGKRNETVNTTQATIELAVTVDVAATISHIVHYQYQNYYAQGKPLHLGSYTLDNHIRASEGYGLYYNDTENKDNSMYLEDTEKLQTYALDKKKGNLELRLRPLGVQLHYVEGPPRVVYFDQNLPISKLLIQAADAMNINPARRQIFGLVVDPEEQTGSSFLQAEGPIWLDPFKTLSWYSLDQMVNLRIEMKPFQLPVTLSVLGTTNNTTRIQLDFNVFFRRQRFVPSHTTNKKWSSGYDRSRHGPHHEGRERNTLGIRAIPS